MLVFLKLGGSLITNKAGIQQPRRRLIRRLFVEIRASLDSNPDLRILLGHGSGSFGHVPANKFGTLQGVHTHAEWQGFSEVWQAAHALNSIVMEELATAGLPAMAVSPSSAIVSRNREILDWGISPIQAALSAGILPVVFGDAVFDQTLGGTILSTEDLFVNLAPRLHPARILLAGEEKGVWADFPMRKHLVRIITPSSLKKMNQQPENSAHVDVTGGMRQKVEMMAALVEANPEVTVSIFSGSQPGILLNALAGSAIGTTIRADEPKEK
jgi:isopentenyl phosphate kinase